MSVRKFFHLLMYHFILSARQKRGLIMRIDKFLSNAGAGSRSQVIDLTKKAERADADDLYLPAPSHSRPTFHGESHPNAVYPLSPVPT